MPPKGYKKRPYTRSNYKKKAKAKPTKMKTMVKSIVKKELSREIENKESCQTATVFFYQQGLTTIESGDVVNIIPSINQNVTESGRTGNQCKVKRFTLRGYMQLQSAGLSGENPFVPGQFNVRLFIGRLKLTNSSPITANLDQLLRTGAAVLPFNSEDGLSLCRSVNTEVWTVYYDKIHKIGVSQPANVGATYNVATGIGNNEYKLSKIIKIDLTKMIKKNLVFNDSGAIPQNTGLYIWGGIVDSLSSNFSSANALVQMTFDAELSFEDA